MDSAAWFLPALLLCALPAIDAQAKLEPDSAADPTDPVTISLSERRITDKTLRVRYEIKNAPDSDIWICMTIDDPRRQSFEPYIGRDGETLSIHRRLGSLDQGSDVYAPYDGRYVRLGSGKTQAEVMSLRLPVACITNHFDETRSAPA